MSKHHKNGGKFVTSKTRLAIYCRDNFTCQYCHKITDDLTLDHVTPASRGGADKPYNLVTCCKSCNSKKSDMFITDFCGTQDINRILVQINKSIEPFYTVIKQAENNFYSALKIELFNNFTK